MHKNPALFFLIVSIFFFLSFTFPKDSFADRLYQCSPAIAYAVSTEAFDANCEKSALPVDCIDEFGNKPLIPITSGDDCATNAALYYSGIEVKNLVGKCVEKCVATSLLAICPRDSRDGCFDMDLNDCTEKLNPSAVGTGSFCIEYTEVVPTPLLPLPQPTPPPPRPRLLPPQPHPHPNSSIK